MRWAAAEAFDYHEGVNSFPAIDAKRSNHWKHKLAVPYLCFLVFLLTLAGCGFAKKEKQAADNAEKDSLRFNVASARIAT